MKYLSHPKQKLTIHIANIQAYDLEDTLFVKAVLFHDLGKVLNSFQLYITKQSKYSFPHAPISGIIYLLNHTKDDLVTSKNNIFIFNTIISHHGKLKSFNNPNGGYDILDFFTMDIPQVEIDEIYTKRDVVKYTGIKVIDTTNFRKFRRKNKKMTFDLEDFITQKLLFSKLIFADKYEAIYKSDYLKIQNTQTTKQLHQALNKIIKTKDPQRDKFKNDILNSYNKNYNIFTLTAPTGIGKTLTSLELALKVKEDRGLDKVIYILPFTSIIDQTYEIFNNLFPNKITKHHYAVSFRERIELDEEQNNKEYDRWKFILNSWSEPFIVSTLYQLFFAIFSNKNSDNIKFQALQNSVIVLDEVQAIPFDLWKVFKVLLPILSKRLNSTFILMSATMPILTDKTKAFELSKKDSIFKDRNRYILKYLDIDNLEKLSDKIVIEFEKKKSVLCVVNTIKRSKLLFNMVKKKIKECYCLNSYMFFEDRKDVIYNIKDKDSNCVTNKILISTQVIEAGVDLDFDVGFREFAPISSIIQTAGRVNREDRKKISKVYIFDEQSNIYDPIMMSESRKILLEVLKKRDIKEEDILPFIETYFQALDDNKGDSGILDDISIFNFDAISKKNRDAFGKDLEHIKSVALGVDLKSFEYDYFKYIKGLKPYEMKREKEKIIKKFQPNILNIKEKDLNNTAINIDYSDIFGIFYIKNIKGIYSNSSGFLIEDEKEIEDIFN